MCIFIISLSFDNISITQPEFDSTPHCTVPRSTINENYDHHQIELFIEGEWEPRKKRAYVNQDLGIPLFFSSFSLLQKKQQANSASSCSRWFGGMCLKSDQFDNALQILVMFSLYISWWGCSFRFSPGTFDL